MNNFKSLFGKKDNDDYDNYYDRDDEMDDDVTPYGEGKDDGSSCRNRHCLSFQTRI